MGTLIDARAVFEEKKIVRTTPVPIRDGKKETPFYWLNQQDGFDFNSLPPAWDREEEVVLR